MSMPDPMTGSYERVEVITSVQRRRRWSVEEKLRIVEETYQPGQSVSLVARRHGIAANQLFTWRRKERSPQRQLAKRWCRPPSTGKPSSRSASFSGCSGQEDNGSRDLGHEAVDRAAGPKKLLLRSASWGEGKA